LNEYIRLDAKRKRLKTYPLRQSPKQF